MTKPRIAVHRLLWPLLLAGALGGTVGCTQVLLSSGARGEYRFGELQVFADRDFAATYAAAKYGLQDKGLFLVKDERLVVEAELNGRDATDTLVVIKIKELAQARTSIKIRYGLKGDLASAQAVYAAIERRL